MYNQENNSTSEALEQYRHNKHMTKYVFMPNHFFHNQYNLKCQFTVLVVKSKTNYPSILGYDISLAIKSKILIMLVKFYRGDIVNGFLGVGIIRCVNNIQLYAKYWSANNIKNAIDNEIGKYMFPNTWSLNLKV